MEQNKNTINTFIQKKNCRNNLCYIHSVLTAQITQCASTRETKKLMLYKDIIPAYCQNQTEHINSMEDCADKRQFLALNLAVHRKATWPYMVR